MADRPLLGGSVRRRVAGRFFRVGGIGRGAGNRVPDELFHVEALDGLLERRQGDDPLVDEAHQGRESDDDAVQLLELRAELAELGVVGLLSLVDELAEHGEERLRLVLVHRLVVVVQLLVEDGLLGIGVLVELDQDRERPRCVVAEITRVEFTIRRVVHDDPGGAVFDAVETRDGTGQPDHEPHHVDGCAGREAKNAHLENLSFVACHVKRRRGPATLCD